MSIGLVDQYKEGGLLIPEKIARRSMKEPSFRIELVEPEDVADCVQIYFDSFQNTHSLACWPRVADVRAWWENMTREELNEFGANWLKAVSTSTGRIIGFTKWVEPRHGEAPSIHLPTWPKSADHALCDETFGAWARKRRELMGSRGHWYLEMLAVDPAYQGKGIGSALMHWGLDLADKDRVECYLEASPEGVRLYEKMGFRAAAVLDTLIDNSRVKSTWYRNVFMIRPPVSRPKPKT